MAVISMTRQYGAAGTEVARVVAEKMGYRLVDRGVLEEIARRAGISVKSVEDADRTAGSVLLSLFSELYSTKPSYRNVPGIRTEFDETKYRKFLIRIITEIAKQGDVVILGRGSQLILKDHPDTFRFYLVASEEHRVENIMTRYNRTRPRAEKVARREERKRLTFLRNFRIHEPTDPVIYHAVINTGLVGWESVAEFICRVATAEHEIKE